jgi:hypothetical protein
MLCMTKRWDDGDPIPFLWQQREQLKPLCDHYGARVLGKALAQHYALDASRTACHKLAALLTALTDFREWYDYADFYVSFDAGSPAVTACLRELRRLNLA